MSFEMFQTLICLEKILKMVKSLMSRLARKSWKQVIDLSVSEDPLHLVTALRAAVESVSFKSVELVMNKMNVENEKHKHLGKQGKQ